MEQTENDPKEILTTFKLITNKISHYVLLFPSFYIRLYKYVMFVYPFSYNILLNDSFIIFSFPIEQLQRISKDICPWKWADAEDERDLFRMNKGWYRTRISYNPFKFDFN